MAKKIISETVNEEGVFSSGDIGISTSEWYNLLLDEGAQQYIDALVCFLREPKHTGSCKVVSSKNGNTAQHYNSKITGFSQWVHKKLNRFSIKGINGKNIYWGIPMQKGWDTKEGFQWQMRDELVKALQNYLMHNLIQDYKAKEPFNGCDEEYKWALLDNVEGKDVNGIIKCLRGKNIVYNTQVDGILKTLWERKPVELTDCINALLDESRDLNTRIEEFRDGMRNICPSDWKACANDERTASAILTCRYPDIYTFYKSEVYQKICKFFGFESRAPYLKFEHFIEIINDFAAEFGEEIQQIMMPQIGKYKNRPLNLAIQTLFWCMKEEMNTTQQKSSVVSKEENMSENKYQKYIDLLKEAHNLVLTGAPGTGKTYLAKEIAKAMNAECEFVQFHPSYDYTDFVEGLRPIKKEVGEMGFERKDGIFKEFCKQAIKNLEDSKKTARELSEEKSFEDKYNELIDRIETGEINEFPLRSKEKKMEVVKISDYNNIILKTSGLTNDRTYTVSFARISKLAKVFPNIRSLYSINNINEEIRDVIGGCNTSAYWAVLYEIYSQGGANDEQSIYRNREETLSYIDNPRVLRDDNRNTIIKEKPYLFIIDEINRGEISKIFGELFFSIDPGYRGQKGRVKTQYQNLIEEGDVFEDGFYVPENVYILGTMNDIDRSVESMDFAMRRRFTWKEVTPFETESMLDVLACEDEAKETMKALNNAIADTEGLGVAYMIGPSYFLKLGDNGGDFNKLWEMNIEPLLKEYLRGFRKSNDILKKFRQVYYANIESSDDNNDLIDEN